MNGGSYSRATSMEPYLAMWFWSRSRNSIWCDVQVGCCCTKREPLVDGLGVQADDAADRLVQVAGAIGVVFHQVVQVEHRVLGQHQRTQGLQVGLADRLARLDPLQACRSSRKVP